MKYESDKKIKIEIHAPTHPANGYAIWEDKEGGKCIERNAEESDIEYILYPDQYQQFLGGKYKFSVSVNLLTNAFSYLY